MKNKIILLLTITICLTLVGCGSKENEEAPKEDNVKTKLSCTKEQYLFHSRKRIGATIYLDKDNKLVDYEYVEVYYEFDSDSEFEMICEGSAEEEALNNRSYAYLTQKADCNKDTRVVTITNKYDMTKVPSKNVLEAKYVISNLNDDYILDLDHYKTDVDTNGYTCE